MNLLNNTPINPPLPDDNNVNNSMENVLFQDIGTRTRRLIEKHELKVLKSHRTSLIQRALGVRKNVFVRQEQAIVTEQMQTFKDGGVNEYP